MLPKLSNLNISYSQVANNMSGYAYYNIFSCSMSNADLKNKYVIFHFSLRTNHLTRTDDCQSFVKEENNFNRADHCIHLQNKGIDLITDKEGLFQLYLAAKANYLTTNSSIETVQENAKGSISMGIIYRHSDNINQEPTQQTNSTLLFHSVSNSTGRFYNMTSRKD